MSTTIMAFTRNGEALVSEAELDSLAEQVRDLAPPAARIDVRALDNHYMRIMIPEGSRPQIMRSDELAAPAASAVATIYLDDSDAHPERTANEVLDRLDAAIGPLSSAAFDARKHLDLVGDGPQPPAYAFIMNTRRHVHSRDEYIWYYRTRHTSLAKELEPAFVRYTTHRVMHARGDLIKDAVTVQEFPSLEAFESHLAVRTRRDDEALADIKNFVGSVDYFVGARPRFL